MEHLYSVVIFIIAFIGLVIVIDFFVEVKKSIFVCPMVVKLFGIFGIVQIGLEFLAKSATPLWEAKTFTSLLYAPFILVMVLTLISGIQIKIRGARAKLSFKNSLATIGISAGIVTLLFFIGIYVKLALFIFLFLVAAASIWATTKVIKFPKISKRIKPAGFETVSESTKPQEREISLTKQDEIFKIILEIKSQTLSLQTLTQHYNHSCEKYQDKASRETIDNAYNHLAKKFT